MMLAKRHLKITLSIILLLSLVVLQLMMGGYGSLSIAVDNIDKSNTNANIETYITEEGSEHKIYWAQGIDAPKMTSNSQELGKPGFFEKDIVNDYVTYQAPMETGHGYYDLNKNPNRQNERIQCYLASATNLLHWWLLQNRTYINVYIERLKEGKIYSQPSGLIDILPYNQSMWNNILEEPQLRLVENFYAQELGYSKLAKPILGNYFSRDDGFWMDRVFDFFLNGYPAQGIDTENNPENFTMDHRGGFFFPIFGRERLSKRMTSGEHLKYDFYNKNLSKLLSNGYGVSLSYYPSNNFSHAITLWGAEYDENNNLTRVFVTDSDDFYNISNSKSDTIRGMHSMEVGSNDRGMFLTNKKNATVGAYMQGLVTLNLAQDIWQDRLDNPNDPALPQITREQEDVEFPIGASIKLEVNAKSQDKGYLTYQWYEYESTTGESKIIEGETKNSYVPSSQGEGARYYYCLISNHRNGKITSLESRHIKVTLKDIPLVNAETPKFNFDHWKVEYNQYSNSNPIVVNAYVNDGGTLTYQWYIAPDSAAPGTPIKGATSNVFYPPTNNAGRFFYYVEVTNTNNNANGSKVAQKRSYAKIIMINSAEIIDASVPIIEDNIKDAIYNIGDSANGLNINAKVNDGGILSYQWYVTNNQSEQGVKINGAIYKDFIPPTDTAGVYYYYCEVTNTNEKASNTKIARAYTRYSKITIKEVEPILPPNITSPKYDISNGVISNINHSTIITDFLSNINGGENIVVLKDGQIVSKDSLIATGMLIRLVDGSEIKDELTVVVTGDIDGDGIISESDSTYLKRDILKDISLNDIYLQAGDMNKDGKISITDFVMMEKKRLQK